MARSLAIDRDEKIVKRTISKPDRDKIRRDRARERKIERMLRVYDNLPTDEIERRVDEDFDEMDIELDESEQFFDDLQRNSEMEIKSTGSRWHSYHKPLGRYFESIRQNCNEHNKTTILIVRGHDKAIYRLSVRRGEEDRFLSSAIKQGYILSKVFISNVDEEKV